MKFVGLLVILDHGWFKRHVVQELFFLGMKRRGLLGVSKLTCERK